MCNNVDIYFFFASLTIILAGVNCKVANKYNLRFINLQIYFGLFLKFGKNRNALLDGEKITSNFKEFKRMQYPFLDIENIILLLPVIIKILVIYLSNLNIIIPMAIGINY